MPSFLNKVVETILNKPNCTLDSWTVVVPNRRAVRFIQQMLAQQISKPIFSPTFLTINDFMEQHAPLTLLPEEELLCYLYQSYCEILKSDAQNFKDFLSWATIFLRDCDEIDRQLADCKGIFSNIKNIKELELIFLNEEKSYSKEKYLRFYESLHAIREQFIKNLYALKGGYEGLIYREAAENISNYEVNCNHNFLFAGFLALSPAELEVLAHYKNKANAQFLFDIDELYRDNHAEFFLKQIESKLKINEIEVSRCFEEPKEITVTGISGNTVQIYHAISLLNKIEVERGNLENTALVFADESLITPFVHAYSTEKCNVSMGYPIKQTAVYQLLYNLLKSHKNATRFSEMQGKGEPVFYHKDVVALLRSPLINSYILQNQNPEENTLDPIERFIALNQIFVTKARLPFQDIIKEILAAKPNCILKQIIALFEEILKMLGNAHTEYPEVQTVLSALLKVDQLFEKHKNIITTSDFQIVEYFIHREVDKIKIAFRGDFKKGLQVMGVLESRTIDFERVIILSCNDSILPKNTNEPSMILYDVKHHFKLPNSQYKESVFAYHFFRLLQRAKNVHLIHNTDCSSSLMEKSRFIHQLHFEIEKRGFKKHITWVENELHILPNLQSKDEGIEVSKSEVIIEKLKKYTYSASSLSKYIRCPLSFYLSSIAKIKPYETINENIESNILGTVVHEALKEVFLDIKNFGNPNKHIDTYVDKLDEHVERIIKKQKGLEHANLTEGKLYLAFEVIKKYLSKYLEQAKVYLRDHTVTIYSIEDKHPCSIKVNGIDINLNGFMDRIDVIGKSTFILDYKTGKVAPQNINMALELKNNDDEIKYEITHLFQNYEKSQLFQLLFYAFLIKKENKISKNAIQCGLISFQSLFTSPDDYTHYATFEKRPRGGKFEDLKKEVPPLVLQHFTKNLITLLEEILNPDTPFKATTDINRCKYCDYATICSKFNDSDW